MYRKCRDGVWSWRSYAIDRGCRIYLVLIPGLLLTLALDSLGLLLFGVSYTEEQQRKGDVVEYNFAPRDLEQRARVAEDSPVAQIARNVGTDVDTFLREAPGMSAFALEDGAVYHTYSAYARGLDSLWGMYQWLDRAPKGRNESGTGAWWRRHDEYDGAKL